MVPSLSKFHVLKIINILVKLFLFKNNRNKSFLLKINCDGITKQPHMNFAQFYFNSFSLSHSSFNRYFHLQKCTSASAVSITMASPYISHTCPIPSWSMHVMSRSSYIIALDATYSSSCTLHRNGLC